jgi:hypothetical protein
MENGVSNKIKKYRMNTYPQTGSTAAAEDGKKI